MRSSITVLGLLALVQECYSHYTISTLVVNGSATPRWKYIRKTASLSPYAEGEFTRAYPFYSVTSQDIVCGRNEPDAASHVSTATVIAGDEVGFRVTDILGNTGTYVHEGPGQVYMSKVPNGVAIEKYDGSGDWFKIAYIGPASNNEWKLTMQTEMKVKIPKTTPPGKYLLRAESFYPQPVLNDTQFYVSCAHIDLVGPGGGVPTGLVKFPGAYNATEPGILITKLQFDQKTDLLRYQPPGPAVWQG